MKKRGVGSPDKADALMLAFLDDRSDTFFDEFFMDARDGQDDWRAGAERRERP